jgi:hypothetical protein
MRESGAFHTYYVDFLLRKDNNQGAAVGFQQKRGVYVSQIAIALSQLRQVS